MNDVERLRRELRAAREELIRKRSEQTDETEPAASCLPLMPDRDEEFLRLALVTSSAPFTARLPYVGIPANRWQWVLTRTL